MKASAMATAAALRARRAADSDLGLPSSAFFGVDLSGEEWAGARLSCVSLRGAILDGADFTGAHLYHVDLSGASLRGACLERTTFQQVSAVGASFAGARCADAAWSHLDCTSADFTRAQLQRALARVSLFEQADFTDADLSGIRLIDCTCSGASFCGTAWGDANTSGSRFVRAQFEDARRFSRCREIVVELLSREVGDDLERAKLVGALALHDGWCYPEWAGILALQPHYRRAVAEIFRRYPRSGCDEALRAAERSEQSRAGAARTPPL